MTQDLSSNSDVVTSLLSQLTQAVSDPDAQMLVADLTTQVNSLTSTSQQISRQAQNLGSISQAIANSGVLDVETLVPIQPSPDIVTLPFGKTLNLSEPSNETTLFIKGPYSDSYPDTVAFRYAGRNYDLDPGEYFSRITLSTGESCTLGFRGFQPEEANSADFLYECE